MAFENATDEDRDEERKQIELQKIEMTRRGTYFFVEDMPPPKDKDEEDFYNLDSLTKGLPNLSPVQREGKHNRPMHMTE